MASKLNRYRLYGFVFSVGFAILFILVCNSAPLEENLARCLVDREPGPDGVKIFAVQYIMWVLFFWGLSEILIRFLFVRKQEQEIDSKYLRENPNALLAVEQMPTLLTSIDNSGQGGILSEILRPLVQNFQTNTSTTICNDLLNSQIELRSNDIDRAYSILRYIIWMLPTLGFIGTVWGILNALKVNMESESLLTTITEKMSVAFWTTLLALILTSIIMYLMQYVQCREESYLNYCHRYCLEHFVNKLYERRN